MEEWSEEILKLAKIAEIYPQSAYAAFTHGIVGKWRYTMRTNQNIGALLQPLEDAINENLIPALTGRGQCSREKRKLLSHSRPCTGSKSKQRNGNMVTELGKLRMPLSHL